MLETKTNVQHLREWNFIFWYLKNCCIRKSSGLSNQLAEIRSSTRTEGLKSSSYMNETCIKTVATLVNVMWEMTTFANVCTHTYILSLTHTMRDRAVRQKGTQDFVKKVIYFY